MKTILHIIDTTGPGGAETVFIDLAARLPESDFKAVVVIRGKGWVNDELIRRGIKPIILDAKGSFNWRYLLKLRKIVKMNKVDLIQSHLLGSNVYSGLLGLITRVPVIATFHGTVDIGDEERFKSLKFAAINSASKKIIAVSNNLATDILKRTPVNKDKLKIIYNGIAIEDFNQARSDSIRDKFGWNKETIIVGSLGNIRTAKAYDILLHAAALLKEKPNNFKFVIAGAGNNGLHERLIKLRNELGLEDDVYFLGFSDNPAEFLSNLDVFLLSSSSEGFSISTIQAMASGIPVVATKSGGPEEIITHNKNGQLVNTGDPSVIAEALQDYVDNQEKFTLLAQNAKSYVATKFNIEAMIESYKKYYIETLD